ncbi:hypothetical protein BJ508DRAFT_358189 [Ascobolus immersus RN42]|uniref:Uncharacterized protein n=1 Tax=Ascobolus immersus RN42 TaxID=1160509 RepID=A0A3N4IPD4_ASCIM|nr:hypothetical protein BJ508DRAFT_358189 [Ascobolus immersus RN42]
MLATPLRTDSLEGARLPRFFLLRFQIRLHPLTSVPWIVPVDIDPREPANPKGEVVGESAYLQCSMKYLQMFGAKGRQDGIFTPEVRERYAAVEWRGDMDVYVLGLLRRRVLWELGRCTVGREEMERREREEVRRVEEEYGDEGGKFGESKGGKEEVREKKDVELLWRYPDPGWKPVCFETYPMGPMFGDMLDEVKEVLGVKDEGSTLLKVFDRRNREAICWLYKLRMYIRQK